MTDRVAVVDPSDGRVLAWLDLSGLRSRMGRLPQEAVANGLAHDPSSGRFFVTGKLWPFLFELGVDQPPGKGASADSSVSPEPFVSKDVP
jgi:glutamine cyclotransferase